MEKRSLPGNIPAEGFIKLTRPEPPALTAPQKVQLNRRGNELFSAGRLEEAKKIFVATGYTDGMIRLGDAYIQRNEHLLALQMFKLAPAPDRVAAIIQLLTKAVRQWLNE